MTSAAARRTSLSARSKGPSEAKVALAPQRGVGRERVALILDAAAEVIQERGYDAATMKEFADRSGTKIGSLYRFFPTKELVADALIQLHAGSLEAQWQAIVAQARTLTTERFADLLLDAYVEGRKTHKPLVALIESPTSGSRCRVELRIRTLARAVAALKAHAPHLKPATARNIAIVMLYNMRTMVALTFDPGIPNAAGAIDELRTSVRIYLANRLRPER